VEQLQAHRSNTGNYQTAKGGKQNHRRGA